VKRDDPFSQYPFGFVDERGYCMVFVLTVAELFTLVCIIFEIGVSSGYIVTKVNILRKEFVDNTKR
jgi:hypothetical protein